MELLLLRTAWRQTRGAGGSLFQLIVCVGLGAAALSLVGGAAAMAGRAVFGDAKALLGADLSLNSSQPPSAPELALLKPLEARGAQVGSVAELVGMASDPAAEEFQLCELKAVGPSWPFYGKVETDPPDALAAVRSGAGVVVEESLLARLDLNPGDTLKLGSARFKIAGVLIHEPDRVAGTFSLGPQVLLSLGVLSRTGLVQPTSRVRWRALIKLPAGWDADSVKSRLEPALKPERVSVETWRDAHDWLRRALDDARHELGLAGLAALLIGGIGVAAALEAFLRERLSSAAILEALGMTPGEVLVVFLLQAAGMALTGAASGAAAGAFFCAALPRWVPELPAVSPMVLVLPSLKAAGEAFAVAMLFAAWPLAGLARARPLAVLRREEDDIALRPLHPRLFAALALAAGLWVVKDTAGSWRLTGLFLITFAGSLLVLAFLAWAMRQAALKAALPRAWPWRHALRGLRRPGAARTAALCAGLGTAAVLLVSLVSASFQGKLVGDRPAATPDFFFIDLQPSQKQAFTSALSKFGAALELHPVARGRLESVKGKPVAAMDLRGKSDGWYFEREYVSTFASKLPARNRIVSGTWPPPDQPWVSVEEDAAKHLGLGIGDPLVMDVEGHRLKARVATIRSVRWGDFTTNFFMIFSPALQAGLPTAYLATAQVPAPERRALERAVVREFPNVTVFAVKEILETVAATLDRIAKAVRLLALLIAAAGLAVVFTAASAAKLARRRETAILKAVGAEPAAVARAFVAENVVVGVCAAAAGALCGAAAAWAQTRWLFHVPFVAAPVLSACVFAGAAAATAAAGFFAVRGALSARPLEVLRSE